jgi:hypothetical protein
VLKINYLIDEGHLIGKQSYIGSSEKCLYGDELMAKSCNLLLNNRTQLSIEEEEIIHKIAQRFI